MKTERDLFQAWYEDAYHEISQMLPSGQYASLRQQHSWGAWQASASREGYKLVPVEKVMDCLYQISDRSYVDDNVSELKAMIGAAP